MKFVFDYEEVLSRRVTIDANNIADAVKQVHAAIENCSIVLDSDDFLSAAIKMPLEQNPHTVRLEYYGENVKNPEEFDIVIDEW